MENNVWILFYSKFSKACDQLVQRMGNVHIPFEILPVCVDSEVTRKRIRESKFNINFIPCLINIDRNTGVAEQYEGEKSFELIEIFESKQEEERQRIEMQNEIESKLEHEQKVESETIGVTPLDVIDTERPDMNSGRTNADNGAIKQRVSAKSTVDSILRERAKMDNELSNTQHTKIEIVPDTKPMDVKKTGSPIDIASALAAAQGRE